MLKLVDELRLTSILLWFFIGGEADDEDRDK